MKTAAAAPEEHRFILSSLPPGPAQRRLALVVALILLVTFLITAGGPFSKVQLPQIGAFIPAYGTAMLVNDLITAVLLFAQFSMLRSYALLAISIGYLSTALVAIPWMLTFPGVFAPAGLLGANPQSTAWLYILWHTGFPVCVIAYALLKEADPARREWRGSVQAAILSSAAVTAGVVAAETFLVTASEPVLPPLMLDDKIRLSPAWFYAAGAVALLILLALVVLWRRRRSVLDLWLTLVLCAQLVEVNLISFPLATRYSVGWYTGRVCGLLSGSLVLFVLLYETTFLYGQLLRALLAQRREREARLMTGDALSASIAHEVRQPLAAMITNADAGLRWLNRASPDLEEAKAAFRRIATDGHRAGAVIENIRAFFRKDAGSRTSLDINEPVREVLALKRADLLAHRVSVEAELNDQLPPVKADHLQLQQVLLNLITNAIESMAAKDGERMLCIRSRVHDSSAVMVSVEDTGTGIETADIDQIFNPLFTTKSDGMGMGLSICRSIIEAHDGRFWATPNMSQGFAFNFVLPADNRIPSAPLSRQKRVAPANTYEY
jgi:signal transduction histidine kinase